MKKIHKKYFNAIFALIMSALMSGIMCFLITAYNIGLVEDLWMRFLSAWKFAFPFALITAQIITPLVRKITALLVEM